jgi:hypothetical protein
MSSMLRRSGATSRGRNVRALRRESDRSAFDRMLKAILDDRPFADAVNAAYRENGRSLWEQFVKSS